MATKRIKNNTYNHYYYNFNFVMIKEDGSVTGLSKYVKDMKIFLCYTDFYFPVVRLTLYVNKELCCYMCDNVDTSKFRLTIKKTKNAGNKTDDDELVLSEDYLKNLILLPIKFDKKTYEEIFDLSTESYEDGFSESFNIKMDLELFLEKHLEILKTPIEGNIVDTTLDQAILYCYKNYLDNNELFMHEVDNQEELEQVILPYKNLPKTIEYLQDTYGIYETGVRIFFDYTRCYLLSNNLINHNILKDDNSIEYDTVYINIYDVSNLDARLEGCCVDDIQNIYVINTINNNTIEFADQLTKEISGEEIKVATFSSESYDSIEELENKSNVLEKNAIDTVVNSQRDNAKKKCYYDTSSNPYTTSTMIAELSKLSLRVILVLENTDLSVLTPNKNYYLHFIDNDDLKKCDGNYQLNSYTVEFIGETKDNRSSRVVAVFDRLTSMMSLS
jgi:hypothetical protein